MGGSGLAYDSNSPLHLQCIQNFFKNILKKKKKKKTQAYQPILLYSQMALLPSFVRWGLGPHPQFFQGETKRKMTQSRLIRPK